MSVGGVTGPRIFNKRFSLGHNIPFDKFSLVEMVAIFAWPFMPLMKIRMEIKAVTHLFIKTNVGLKKKLPGC
jgi:hypothetical protein